MTKSLPYLNKDFENSTKDEIKIKWYKIQVADTYTKRYHVGFGALAALPPLQRNVLEFACEVMDTENIVINDNRFKKGLAEALGNLTTYQDNSVNKAFAFLASTGFMYQLKKRGTYRISPHFFYKGTEKKRMKLIRFLMESNYSTHISKVRKEHYKNL